MKISPLAQGTGVPAQSNNTLNQTADSSKLARAKAIASGQEPVETSGDAQVDRARASLKSIKMNTQQSTNRHETQASEEVALQTETPILDANEPAQETEETKPLSPQFAALARQKRALQIERAEIAKLRSELEQKSSFNPDEYVSKVELLANPLKVFEAGVTYDQLTEAILNNQSAPLDAQKLRAEIKKDLLEELTGQFTSRDQQAEQQVLNDIAKETMHVTAQGEQFEAIREAKAQKAVVDLIHRTWKQSGEILDVSEAAELVENQLIDEALPFAKLSKVQSRLTPAQEAQAAQLPAPKPNTKIMRTLTNRDSATPVMDKRARAIAAMQGTLKRG